MSRSDEFLKSFFDQDIYFLGSRSLQQSAWQYAQGDLQFGSCLLRSFEDWSTILEHREEFNLSDKQIKQIQQLFDMLDYFQETNDFPNTPSQYHALLQNSEWIKIQNYAHHLYTSVGSELNVNLGWRV
ncbi:MAG: hypothetical protein H0V82_03075 [Candidatus Protochlamydia sp.]|nr:hypothetical protein [Candidatus Protochlamydia sp.]